MQITNGKTITTLMNATPISSEAGELESVAVALQDLTPMENLNRLHMDFLAEAVAQSLWSAGCGGQPERGCRLQGAR